MTNNVDSVVLYILFLIRTTESSLLVMNIVCGLLKGYGNLKPVKILKTKYKEQ
jgi:hypothetical protein